MGVRDPDHRLLGNRLPVPPAVGRLDGLGAGGPAQGAGRPAFHIATGANFPDGLSGGPAAAAAHGSLLLVRGTSLHPAVREELIRLAPQRVTILGGTSVVTESIHAEINRLWNP